MSLPPLTFLCGVVMEYEEAVGQWEDLPDTVRIGLPVPDEQYILNIRDNCLLDLPNLEMQKEHDRIMVMVCGGPSAKLYLDEIREKREDDKYRIVSSNMTHDWLISEGIVPHYQFIIDPKPSKIGDVQNPHRDVKYLIGISCDKSVFQALEGYDVTRVFSVSGIGDPSDVHVIKALFPYQEITHLFGGTMAGLRAMSLADVMGFLTLEYYGFDSCYFDTEPDGTPIYYSYDKKRKENILEVQGPSGEIYLTSPVFASQAKQFIKWKHRYEWIKFVIHGSSLTAAMHEVDDEQTRPKHNMLITDYHRSINKLLHNKEVQENWNRDVSYGCSGHLYAGQVSVLVGQVVKRCGEASVLDYGCGRRSLELVLPPIVGATVHNYDPCIDGLDSTPEPADVVVCTDVLEHVEPECLENVLDDLRRVTKQVLFLSISTRLAQKSYSDGQNAHKIVEDHDWWRPKIKKRFFIVETQATKDNVIFVCQSKALRE